MSAPGQARPRVAVVVGNPKPASRTLAAATHLARELSGGEPDLVVDLATLGGTLLDWADEHVASLVQQVGEADLVVFACPTYKASITGLLKLFLDRFAPGTLRGLAVPLMLGAGPGHALAPELTLRPVLAEIGAPTPVRGLYLLDSQHDDPAAYEPWLTAARPVVAALLDRPTPAPLTGARA
ncbi:NADPH-dependent FMN reductase [Nocardioides campestrisoli]|uniref:NADPH-dependent FMN reductase n=1 Tax=Nocardioides campestrisoli TaxID=2736757 RepID=UPI0015E6BF2E|nr:NAD(P)H-dependent oxidoreductase [Nocardioides campestrisoli]